MCGITGFWGSASTDAPQTIIQNMTDAIQHRGPDQDGYWSDPTNDLYFGHRRLSIIDLSDDGAQPMVTKNERYTLIYNGEIYNFQTLRKDLEEKGVSFKGHSDTEVLLKLIEKHGLETTLQKVRGMFAFALWDRENQRLSVARDHFGKKPLYIGWAGESLVFASELKCFMTHPNFQKRVNDGSQSLFMAYGYIPAPNTIFENVWMLPPGHFIQITQQDLKNKASLPDLFISFWSAKETAQKNYQTNQTLSVESALNRFEQILTESVLRRVVSDVPLGSFLSGGIDSSLVTAVMQSQSRDKIKTFSIGFEEKTYNEAPFAKSIASHLQTDHHEFYVSAKDALNSVEKLPEIYDEPFSDISSIPTYLLTRHAKPYVTVALSGDGGDELLGGYTRHISGSTYFHKMQSFPKPLQSLALAILKNGPRTIRNKYHQAIPFFEEDKIENLFQRLLMLSSDTHNWTHHNQKTHTLFDQSLNQFSETDRMILVDVFHTLPNKFLTKVDRASMANGLEVRSPFLDLELFEFAWSLPLEMKVQNKQGKWLMRQLLEKYIPIELFNRPKQGFNIPVSDWINNELKDWAEELLSAEKLDQNGFNSKLVRQAWQSHQNGFTHNADKLWAVCQYQQWAQKWL